MWEAVSRALSHSLATAQQYYQAPTVADAYTAYRVMQEIIRGTRADSPAVLSSSSTLKRGTGAGSPAAISSSSTLKERKRKLRVRFQEEDISEEEQDRGGDRQEEVQQGKRKGKGKWKGKACPSSQDGLSEEEEWWKQGKGKGKARPTFQEAEEQEMGGQEWRQGKRKREPEKDKEDTAGEDMVTAPLGPSPRTRRWQLFTKAQVRLVAEYFAGQISRREFPNSTECRDFIRLYPGFGERNPKDIYDKCRNLAGR